jgi:hypothetical protein
MGMVAPSRRIGSAFVVCLGQYGDVSRFAREQGISRQWVYREAEQAMLALEGTRTRQKIEHLQGEVAQLRQQVAQLQQQLAQAVVVDDEKQTEFACAAQACGVTLPQCHTLLEVLIPGETLSVASLGRRTQALGESAGALLKVCDELARPRVRDGAGDEIYVSDPVLMVVEQESLCWICGHLTEEVTSKQWRQEFAQLPNLEQMAVDGGKPLAKGMALVNEERVAQGQEPVVLQGDHFHALWKAGPGLRKTEQRVNKALAEVEDAEKALAERARQGKKQTGAVVRLNHAWKKAEKAMEAWEKTSRVWQQAKDALPPITPTGELNTRAKAEAVLAQTLSQLPDADFAKCKRALQRSEMFNYLDRMHDRLAQLTYPQEVVEAAVQQETLRRRPELLKGDNRSAAALRGVLLMCTVILSKAEQVGREAVEAVRNILRRAYRASSLVECINSVLRMHQAQHRKMTQGLLDLKRLYWNCHRFRTGRRRGHTPYQLLGLPWPDRMSWWDVLKLTPEQLREKLSTTKRAA